MANKTIIYLGETLDRRIQIRTVNKLADKVEQEAIQKDIPMNTLINQIFYERYFGKKKKP